MLTIIVLFLLLGDCWTQFCGDPPWCLCNTEMGLLACLNNTMKTLPNFNAYEKANTVHLDIANTQLKTLPLFSGADWPNLKIVDIRTNIHLTICSNLEEIFNIKDLTLLIDCPPKISRGFNTLNSKHTAIYASVIMITLILETMAVIAFFLKMELKPTGYKEKSDAN